MILWSDKMRLSEKILITIVMIIILFLEISIPIILWLETKKSNKIDDTIISFNNERFKIVKANIIDGIAYYLVDTNNSTNIAKYIVKYKVNKNKVYMVLGNDKIESNQYKYVVLNYDTGDYYRYYELDELIKEERTIFDDESNFIKIGN